MCEDAFDDASVIDERNDVHSCLDSIAASTGRSSDCDRCADQEEHVVGFALVADSCTVSLLFTADLDASCAQAAKELFGATMSPFR